MRSLQFALLTALSLGSSLASATSLNSTLTADDAFSLYISTNDSVQGTLIGSGNYWPTVHSFNSLLTAGQTNYIHIYANDVYGQISALLGQFSLSDNQFQFANGGQNLLTNTIDWKISYTGFGSNYLSPISYGNNGVSPWGSLGSISSNAQWIWRPDRGLEHGYFSAAINPVPEAEQSLMLLLGLPVLLAGIKRQSQV